MSLMNKIQARMKCVVYKPEDNPDNLTLFCGEPFQRDENGREFAIIPAHCKEYHEKMYPRYEFSDEFEVKEGEEAALPAKKAGRPKK